MKILIAAYFAAILLLCCVPAARAQSPDFIFSQYQCDPLSCAEQTPAPVFQGEVLVTFNGVCAGGAVGGIEAFATSFVGVPNACRVPYTPRASMEIIREALLNDFCDVYLLDTVRQNSDVLDSTGIPVFHRHSEASCDGGTTGIITFGTRPC